MIVLITLINFFDSNENFPFHVEKSGITEEHFSY
jgi:hypothetical protein